MAIEIERKFLLKSLPEFCTLGKKIQQGYIVSEGLKTCRVRTKSEQAFLTIKIPTSGIGTYEFEYVIPIKDAEEMLALCAHSIQKTRFVHFHDPYTLEIDVFEGNNSGLILLEIEWESEEYVAELPKLEMLEVTDDPRFFNANLIHTPFSTFKHDYAFFLEA